MAVITEIEKTNKNKGNMYNVYIDGDLLGLCHIEAIVKNGLSKGRDVDIEHIKSVLYESNKLVALEQSIKYLSKTLKTEKEMRSNLVQKGFENSIIDTVIEKLKEYKYIDDVRYVESFKNASKTKGLYRIRFELKQKGVSEEILQECLSDEEDDMEQVLVVARKYMRNKEVNIKNLHKLYQHLLSRGFGYDISNNVINIIKEEMQGEME